MQDQAPCTDYQETKGLIYFARMLDKISLNAAGKLAPGYFCGVEDPTFFDARCTRFLGVITMSWSGERLRAARTRKSWSGVSPTAEDPAKKKLRSGMRSSPNADGGMKATLT